MFELMPFERRTNNLLNLFDSMERDLFGGMDSAVTAIRTDISEKDGEYLLEAELPGFNKEDIQIEIAGDMLNISAEHKQETENKDQKTGYIRRERRYGSFRRNFDITGIDAEKISASYENAILRMTLPKKAALPEVSRRIELP